MFANVLSQNADLFRDEMKSSYFNTDYLFNNLRISHISVAFYISVKQLCISGTLLFFLTLLPLSDCFISVHFYFHYTFCLNGLQFLKDHFNYDTSPHLPWRHAVSSGAITEQSSESENAVKLLERFPMYMSSWCAWAYEFFASNLPKNMGAEQFLETTRLKTFWKLYNETLAVCKLVTVLNYQLSECNHTLYAFRSNILNSNRFLYLPCEWIPSFLADCQNVFVTFSWLWWQKNILNAIYHALQTFVKAMFYL